MQLAPFCLFILAYLVATGAEELSQEPEYGDDDFDDYSHSGSHPTDFEFLLSITYKIASAYSCMLMMILDDDQCIASFNLYTLFDLLYIYACIYVELCIHVYGMM